MSAYYEDQGVTIHHGDCIEVMRAMPDASVDSIVTDPPYGLGFMGKKWDDLPPGADFATEALRVLKPGGHMLAFGGTRTWHRLATVIEDAGFELRDSIAWMHGQGFPKGKATLKPAFEPIIVARKKAKPGEGLLNIDAARIATDWATDPTARGWKGGNSQSVGAVDFGTSGKDRVAQPHMSGRWPANVVLDEGQAAALDEQSGPTGSWSGKGKGTQGSAPTSSHLGGLNGSGSPHYGDFGGGASRFFYVAKASKRERPNVAGVVHPTVKPLALMRWLLRLVTPEGGVALDPFAGSGTTVEAARLEGFDVVAIEREAEYLPLIMYRLGRTEKPGEVA